LDSQIPKVEVVNYDGFVKALHFTPRHGGVRQVRLRPRDSRALNLELFLASIPTFYEFINYDKINFGIGCTPEAKNSELGHFQQIRSRL